MPLQHLCRGAASYPGTGSRRAAQDASVALNGAGIGNLPGLVFLLIDTVIATLMPSNCPLRTSRLVCKEISGALILVDVYKNCVLWTYKHVQ